MAISISVVRGGTPATAARVRRIVKRTLFLLGVCLCVVPAAAALLLRQRPVPVTWMEISGNFVIHSTAVVPAREAFGLCAPLIDGIGRGNFMDPPPPTILYTPGLATQLGCGLVRADAAARQAWWSWRGEIISPAFDGLNRNVRAALAGR